MSKHKQVKVICIETLEVYDELTLMPKSDCQSYWMYYEDWLVKNDEINKLDKIRKEKYKNECRI